MTLPDLEFRNVNNTDSVVTRKCDAPVRPFRTKTDELFAKTVTVIIGSFSANTLNNTL